MRFVECVLLPGQGAGKLARAACALVCLAILVPAPGLADDVGEEAALLGGVQPSGGSPETDRATLWDMQDAELQAELEAAPSGLPRATRARHGVCSH